MKEPTKSNHKHDYLLEDDDRYPSYAHIDGMNDFILTDDIHVISQKFLDENPNLKIPENYHLIGSGQQYNYDYENAKRTWDGLMNFYQVY